MDASSIKNTETVKYAANQIGVTVSRLRQWIRAYWERSPEGRAKPTGTECKAIKIESEMFPTGYAWKVPIDEIQRLKTTPRTGAGRPRIGQRKRSA